MPEQAGIYYSLSERNHSPFTILLIHGAGSNMLCWSAEMRRLPGYSVIAVDLPGHGRSRGQPAMQSINDYADHLIDFIHNLHLESVVLAGHSMGGAVALEIGRRDLGIIAGLVTISCAARFSFANQLESRLKTAQSYRSALNFLQQSAFSSHTSSKLIRQTMNALFETSPDVVYKDWAACAGFDFESHLSQLILPLLIVVGDEDKITPPNDSIFMNDHIPRSGIEIIPHAGHMVIVEQPCTLMEKLVSFLSTLS
jgi:pimeloyl-ACP methyl ester carboxylesterase